MITRLMMGRELVIGDNLAARGIKDPIIVSAHWMPQNHHPPLKLRDAQGQGEALLFLWHLYFQCDGRK